MAKADAETHALFQDRIRAGRTAYEAITRPQAAQAGPTQSDAFPMPGRKESRPAYDSDISESFECASELIDHHAVKGKTPQGSVQTPQVPTELTSYSQVLAIPEFRTIFAAQTVATLANVVVQITLAVLVFQQSGSPLLSSLTFALGFAPYIFSATLLSALTDRFSARSVMASSHLLSALVIAAMAIPGLPVWAVLVLLVLLGIATPVFQGARAANLPDVLGESGYTLGRSLLRLVSQSTQVIGFAAGGLLLLVWSPATCLLVSAAGCGLAAALVQLGTPFRPPRTLVDVPRKSLTRDSLSGVREILAIRQLRPLLLLTWLPPVFVVAPEALAVPYAEQLGSTSVLVGLLLCGAPVGSVLGELATGLSAPARTRVRLMFPFAILMFLPLLVFVAEPGAIIAVSLLVTCGLGFTYAMGLDQRVLDATPDRLRGQTLTLTVAGLMTGQGIGFALAGALAEVVSASNVIALAGGAGLLSVAACNIAIRRQHRVDHPAS